MSQELLYTSAPRGLKPGSRGFCTVLSTQGMAAPLAAALEGLSGYRPLFNAGDERAARNPVVYSHLKLQAAGRTSHVLSRIADYGLDYSQRANKLAHHVVLDPAELLPGGPANLLSTAEFMRETWEGEPKVVALKPVKRERTPPSGVCRVWQETTGDAGWAGVLAESFLHDPERLVILLFAPGQDVLPLFAEAISLLPTKRRWEVTFSTYFTALAPGATCVWRALVRDSKEAHESLRFVNALRLDIAEGSLGRAEGGDLVDAARTGIRPHEPPRRPLPTGDGADETFAEADDEPHEEFAADESTLADVRFAAVPPPPLQSPPIRSLAPAASPLTEPLVPRRGRRLAEVMEEEARRRPRRRWWVLTTVLMLMAGALGFGLATGRIDGRKFLARRSAPLLAGPQEEFASSDVVQPNLGPDLQSSSDSSNAERNADSTTTSQTGLRIPDSMTSESMSSPLKSDSPSGKQATEPTADAAATTHVASVRGGDVAEVPPAAVPAKLAINSNSMGVREISIRVPPTDSGRDQVPLHDFPTATPAPKLHLLKPVWLPFHEVEPREVRDNVEMVVVDDEGTTRDVFAQFKKTTDTGEGKTYYKLRSLKPKSKWLGWYAIQVIDSNRKQIKLITFSDFPIQISESDCKLKVVGATRWHLPDTAPLTIDEKTLWPKLHLDRLEVAIGGHSAKLFPDDLLARYEWTVSCLPITKEILDKLELPEKLAHGLGLEISLKPIRDNTPAFEVTLEGRDDFLEEVRSGILTMLLADIVSEQDRSEFKKQVARALNERNSIDVAKQALEIYGKSLEQMVKDEIDPEKQKSLRSRIKQLQQMQSQFWVVERHHQLVAMTSDIAIRSVRIYYELAASDKAIRTEVDVVRIPRTTTE